MQKNKRPYSLSLLIIAEAYDKGFLLFSIASMFIIVNMYCG